ncbi:hypothetical protein ACFQDN_22110 [Pseudomonas asuensis]|uniref:Uncharacterized protein n=1 Tax=Pseudomonas asuensis TaxID=1825787 RepID=A0ABQ2H302_9PSED|nr:hypothetical protein [Pseudomonas asuensis]GGM25814.1 hypothetical protein GCM10009425_40660 [Pseudomonas asuensis]
MDDVKEVFARLLDRQPSDEEIKRLYRVKNTLGIHDNDAIWLIIMAFESYDNHFKQYPQAIADYSSTLLSEHRKTFTAMADAESKKVMASLSEEVRRTSEKIANRSSTAAWFQSCGWLLIGLCCLGGLCMFVGAVLTSGRVPYWAHFMPGESMFSFLLNSLARAPSGWLMAIGGSTFSLVSLWKVRHEVLAGRNLSLVASALALTSLSVMWLYPLF